MNGSGSGCLVVVEEEEDNQIGDGGVGDVVVAQEEEGKAQVDTPTARPRSRLRPGGRPRVGKARLILSTKMKRFHNHFGRPRTFLKFLQASREAVAMHNVSSPTDCLLT